MSRLAEKVETLKAWLRRLFRRNQAPPPVALRTSVAGPTLPPEPQPVVPPPIVKVVTPVSNVEAEIRRLERARRKHDKFVEPKGEPPAPRKARSQEIKPTRPVEIIMEAPESTVKDARDVFADRHHEGGETVLYKEAEWYGEFNFRDTILQQLDRYFVYLKRMKKNDPDAYGFYRKVGATIIPYLANGSWHRQERDRPKDDVEIKPLPPWFNATRPAFGCFVFGADPETEKFEAVPLSNNLVRWVPKFMYFTKYSSPPPDLQQKSGGDIYVLTVWWDRPFDAKIKQVGVPQQVGIFISRDGKEIIPLRVIDTKLIPVRPKKNRAREKEFHIPVRAWRLPGLYEDWAKENGCKNPEKYLTSLFLMAVEIHDATHLGMVRVAATKGNMTAVFSVNIHRMSYFFQDRDWRLSEHGTRKPIFHMVRPHVRSNGTTIKAHFRGERHFTWAGYDIRISIPGRDHADINEIDIGCDDEYWHTEEEKKDFIAMPELGAKLKGWIDKGFGAYSGGRRM